jgi:hypothetical protein
MSDTKHGTGNPASLAAALFAAAARRSDLQPDHRLACLQAEQTLHTAVASIPGATPLPGQLARLGTHELIATALRTLGALPFEDFRQPHIRTAARYGRQALYGRQG